MASTKPISLAFSSSRTTTTTTLSTFTYADLLAENDALRAALNAARAHSQAVENGLQSAQTRQARTQKFLNDAQKDNSRLTRLLRDAESRVTTLRTDVENLREALEQADRNHAQRKALVTAKEVTITEMMRQMIGLRRMYASTLQMARMAFKEGRKKNGAWTEEGRFCFGEAFPESCIAVEVANDGRKASKAEKTKPDLEHQLRKRGLQQQALDPECPVCKEPYNNEIPGLHKSVLPCGHAMHEDCIQKWFDNSMNCPYCREEFVWVPAKRSGVPDFILAHNEQRQEASEADISRYNPPSRDEMMVEIARHAGLAVQAYDELVRQQVEEVPLVHARNARARRFHRRAWARVQGQTLVEEDEESEDEDSDNDGASGVQPSAPELPRFRRHASLNDFFRNLGRVSPIPPRRSSRRPQPQPEQQPQPEPAPAADNGPPQIPRFRSRDFNIRGGAGRTFRELAGAIVIETEPAPAEVETMELDVGNGMPAVEDEEDQNDEVESARRGRTKRALKKFGRRVKGWMSRRPRSGD